MTGSPERLGPTLLLSQGEVAHLLTMQDAVDTVRAVFRAHGLDQVAMPPKISLDLRRFHLNAWHNAMPGFIEPLWAAGIKWAGGYPDNPTEHGLPYVMALIVAQDPTTGYPLAVMDGTHITALRTGAVAGVVVEYFGQSKPGPAAFVGAGVQARTALEAMMLTRPPSAVAVYDVVEDRAKSFADAASQRFELSATATTTVEGAVTGASTVITATPADAPLVRADWLAPGTTSISFGSFQEFDDAAVLQADKLVVDSWDQCAHRGELKRFAESGRLSRSDVFAEIGETVSGRKEGRQNATERILVVPIGLGTHDVALANLAWVRSKDEPRSSFDFLEGARAMSAPNQSLK